MNPLKIFPKPQLSRLWLGCLLPTICVGTLGLLLRTAWEPQGKVQAQVPSSGAIAQPADQFVDTIGVNAHLYYTDTVYNNFDTLVKPRLTELGIRHIRDGAYTSGWFYSTFYQRCKTLAQSGIRFNLVMLNQAQGTSWQPSTDFTKLNTIYQDCGQGVVSFEGSNEPDLFGPMNGAPDWIAPNRTAQQQLYYAVKGSPNLAHLPVISPSVTSWGAAIAMGNLSSYLNYGNMHNYFAGRNPETSGWGGPFKYTQLGAGQSGCYEISLSQYSPFDPTASIYGTVSYNVLCNAHPISGGKTVITTETGWDNAVNQPYPGSVPETVAATYVPRLFLHHWNQGIARTYLYELFDVKPDSTKTEPEHNFGLLRNNGVRKPAYYALRYLIKILKDPGGSFQTKPLNYQLTGNLANVHRTLLQKRNGDYFLALWLGVPIWEPNQRKSISVPAQAVTLTLNDPTIRTVTQWNWQSNGSILSSSQPLTLNSNLTSQVNLQVSPRLTILRLSAQ